MPGTIATLEQNRRAEEKIREEAHKVAEARAEAERKAEEDRKAAEEARAEEELRKVRATFLRNLGPKPRSQIFGDLLVRLLMLL